MPAVQAYTVLCRAGCVTLEAGILWASPDQSSSLG